MDKYIGVLKIAALVLTEEELIEFKYLLLKRDSYDIEKKINANLRISKFVDKIEKRAGVLKKQKAMG